MKVRVEIVRQTSIRSKYTCNRITCTNYVEDDTITAVPLGSGQRIGLDRNLNGILNFDELPPVVATFTGIPSEYDFVLNGGDIDVTDLVPARDGLQTITAGTLTADFAGVTYTLMVGTNGVDILTGGNADELIIGFDGADTLRGLNGNDALIGGAGVDRLYGDNGNDILGGGDDNDIMFPGLGDDNAQGGDGSDLIVLADPGNPANVFNGGPGTGDVLLLANGYGTFTMTSQQGFERFNGGDGDDNIDWSSATTSVNIRGNNGNDTLQGGSSNDILYSGIGNDTLMGNGGNDLVVLSDPANLSNVFDGGTGTDRLLLASGYGSFTMASQQGFEKFTGGDGDDDRGNDLECRAQKQWSGKWEDARRAISRMRLKW